MELYSPEGEGEAWNTIAAAPALSSGRTEKFVTANYSKSAESHRR
jgi:hypothetical protein